MKNRIKKYIGLMAAVLALGLNAGSYVEVAAAQEGNVYDDAALLTETEIDALNDDILALQEASGWNVYAVTTADASGKSAMAYADDFFDEHSPEQEDGVVVLVDMDNREITISACGDAMRYLTDERVDAILDDAYADAGNDAYGDCLDTMLDGIAGYYDAGIQSNQYNYDTETGAVSRYRTLTLTEILIALVIAVGVGAIIYGVVVGKYQLRFGTYQYDFRESGRVDLRVRDDHFVNQTVTHRRIPKENTSGGGGSSGRTSTHTSSSGRTHSGGSRKF